MLGIPPLAWEVGHEPMAILGRKKEWVRHGVGFLRNLARTYTEFVVIGRHQNLEYRKDTDQSWRLLLP